MSPFVKLKNPGTYVACPHDLVKDHDARVYWVEWFRKHYLTLLKLGVDAAVKRGESREAVQQRADACRDELYARLDAFLADPASHGSVSMLKLDDWRDGNLRKHGFADCFIDLKATENELALPLLPRTCAQIDAITDPAEQIRAVVEGVFAGNIFDMGAKETAKKIIDGTLDFFHTRDNLPKRPWHVDQFDALQQAWLTKRYKKVVMFIDNAGADFLLGALPLLRWFARRGTEAIIAANEVPALNDMTVHDIREFWPGILETEPSFRHLPIRAVSSGTKEPLIDLLEISDELNEAAQDADLVILEGMGRSVECNLDAAFTCDAANLAMVKDAMVARWVGGKMYDVICRFR